MNVAALQRLRQVERAIMDILRRRDAAADATESKDLMVFSARSTLLRRPPAACCRSIRMALRHSNFRKP
jgi:hypothetical protein